MRVPPVAPSRSRWTTPRLDRLDVFFSEGDSLVLGMDDTNVQRNVSVTAEGGGIELSLSGNTFVGGSVKLRTTDGSSQFRMSETASLRRSLRQWTRGGQDSETRLSDQATVGGVASVRNLEGVSDVQIRDEAQVKRFVGSGFTVQRRVTYVNRDGRLLKADIYTPKSQGPHPAVVAVHGGGWVSGNQAKMSAEARELAQRGYVVMSINYRLAPTNRFPAQVHDVKAAIQFIKAHAAEFDVDANQVGLWGYSAGAHLALLAGLTDAADGLEDPDAPVGSPNSLVQAVVAAAPPTDFRDVDLDSNEFRFLFGGTRREVPELYEQASPAHWVSGWDPPVYMYIGENDNLVSGDKAAQLADDLEAVGVDAELYTVPKKNHLTAKRDRTAIYQSLRFLDMQLKA